MPIACTIVLYNHEIIILLTYPSTTDQVVKIFIVYSVGRLYGRLQIAGNILTFLNFAYLNPNLNLYEENIRS